MCCPWIFIVIIVELIGSEIIFICVNFDKRWEKYIDLMWSIGTRGCNVMACANNESDIIVRSGKKWNRITNKFVLNLFNDDTCPSGHVLLLNKLNSIPIHNKSIGEVLLWHAPL